MSSSNQKFPGQCETGFETCSFIDNDGLLKLKYSPTAIVDSKPSAYEDALRIQKGFNDNSHNVFNTIFPFRSPDHIKDILQEFEKIDKNPLWKRIKEDMADPYRYVIMTLEHNPAAMRSYVLFNALVECQDKIDIDAIIYIFVTHNEQELDLAKTQYQQSYHAALSDKIIYETGGYLQRALLTLLEKKDNDDISEEEVSRLVRLFTAPGSVTDGMKDQMIRFLCKKTPRVIIKVIKEYEMMTHKSLEEKFNILDQFEKCLRSIVCYIADPAKYYAYYLYEGVQERNVKKISNVICLRYHADMGHIAYTYSTTFPVPLGSELRSTFHKEPDSLTCFLNCLGELK